ncbi:MAG: LacI family DNA-binding transcriptional regulator [Albidovulum sp.]|nr:LacI family DNA-binding transcriptional regulator [Albidovulum sp.]MDE0304739.1 LacI family DNA-binding transcriptional regulator [Albidovulum sp.]MDE0530481.1 LacI family DNA-binding transcriptional regulator [Albidovulum sp.]
MVSIKEVARLAGVSDKTVSRVVNREPNVRADTFTRVQRVIAETGYVPNMAARHMRSSRSNTMGIITDYISTTPYSGNIVRGIQDWAAANGRTVLLANTNGHLDKELESWKMFMAHRIEGALYVTMYHRIASPERGSVTLPSMLINCRSAKEESEASIEPDDFQGSRDLTRFVLARGHRRIGYLRLNPKLLGAEERHTAFRATVREAGLGESDIDVRLGMEGPIGSERNHVYREARSLLEKANRPSVLMCGNDEMALQAYLAALGMGLQIPQDVSIVGFDDFQPVSLALKPELTTAALPYYDLGYRGAERLDSTIAGKPLASRTLTLDCPLVVRSSCAPV